MDTCSNLFAEGLPDRRADLLQLRLAVHVAVPVLLRVNDPPAVELHLKDAGVSGRGLPSEGQLSGEARLQVLLQLPEFGGVTSSSAMIREETNQTN